jgi:hypothetical protein
MSKQTNVPNEEISVLTRRRLLAKLGLAVTVVYAAPVLMQLSEARASGASGPRRRVRVRRGTQRASSYSGPSGGERLRRPIRAEGPQRRRIRTSSFSGPSFSR